MSCRGFISRFQLITSNLGTALRRLLGLLGLLVVACQPASPPAPDAIGSPALTRARFYRLLHAGDSVYAQRSGYEAIGRSMRYFDQAYVLARQAGDTLLLAEATFAKGRVYDAWNKAPYQTIRYFRQAVGLFEKIPMAWRRTYYARYLLVHAYDKVPDPRGTARAARQLYHELRAQPDRVRQQVAIGPELAWSCTEVGLYGLADSVLRDLTRRAWVRNDPESYDHLTHYYLVRARLDVLYHMRPQSAYVDSLDAAYQQTATLFDREYYSRQLAPLYAAIGQYGRAYERLDEHRRHSDSLAGASEVAAMRHLLYETEQQAAVQQAREQATAQRRRFLTVSALVTGLLLLGLLSAYFYRQNRRSRAQAAALAQANHALDEQVHQVELLNKEIQHRVKNNLHMVFSLLQMQERRSTDDEVISQLQAARLRVESVAALHNQLLRQPDGFDLGPYLRSLISNVVTCLANDKQVVTHLQTDVLHLPERTYLPLSLILNEWVTNSIKYAEPLPTGAPLEITVAVRQDAREVCVRYYDSGRTAPANVPGLGSQLITLLSRQLGATLHRSAGRPFDYELCIPHSAPSPAPANGGTS